jgi:hypothetical protein
MKSQSIAYLLNGSEHTYWIWDLEGEAHSMWDLWISGLQECKGNGFSKVGWVGNIFWWGPKNLDFLDMRLPLPEYFSPEKLVGGELIVPLTKGAGNMWVEQYIIQLNDHDDGTKNMSCKVLK